MDQYISETDFTMNAWEYFYDAVDNIRFRDKDAELIFNSLKNRFKLMSFADHLKRYIYRRAELTEPFGEVPLSDYQSIIRSSFSDLDVPASFESTSVKVSAAAKNWLTQSTVRRKVVFLLGFGLAMSVEDVNNFLTKVLQEQAMNPKDPFEVICWYCYTKHYGFHKYEKLMEQYQKIDAVHPDATSYFDDNTLVLSGSMSSINDDIALLRYLARLKHSGGSSIVNTSSRRCFEELYKETCKIVADLINVDRDQKHKFTPEEITPGDIEHVICSAVPTDKHGNLTPAGTSVLASHFRGKRFSRQRISELLKGEEIARFDLITLNFFIFSQRYADDPNSKHRYSEFIASTNSILEQCYMCNMYVSNPYECFLMMCMLSDDPLGTYADVIEMSYE